MTKKIYFENLDGLRSIAFLMVFLSHAWRNLYFKFESESLNEVFTKILDVGPVGVNLFFVLSGFLITYLLIVEKEETKRINVVNFYIRRILRIWPVYYLVVIVFVFIAPAFVSSLKAEYAEITITNVLHYLFFLVNFDHIDYGIPFRWATVLWSVSVEEQFYFLWPLVLWLTPLRKLPIVLIFIIIFSMIFRGMYFESYRTTHYHTLSVMGDLSVGALGAWISLYRKEWLNNLVNINRLFKIGIYLAGSTLLLFRYDLFQGAYLTPWNGLLGSLFFLFIILEQTFSSNSIFKMKNNALLSQYGKYTYGLYCYHFIAIFMINGLRNAFQVNTSTFLFFVGLTLASLALSVILARVSYHFMEYPLLKRKVQFSYVQTS